MTNPNIPNDPYRVNPADDEIRRPTFPETELQADPVLDEGSTGGSRIAMYAVAGALVLGALFYGFSNSNMNQAGTTPASQSAQTDPATKPATPPGMRDVTPKVGTDSNMNPGVTTGAAPARPTPPATNTPAQSPAGSMSPAAPK